MSLNTFLYESIEPHRSTITFVLQIAILISVVACLVFLYKYHKTKKKDYLWFGLGLVFVIPGILILFNASLGFFVHPFAP